MQCQHIERISSEKYSRGRRGAPAKGVGRATGARVQIPLSPLNQKRLNLMIKVAFWLEKFFSKKFRKNS